MLIGIVLPFSFPYENSDGDTIDLYDAQLYLLSNETTDEKAAKKVFWWATAFPGLGIIRQKKYKAMRSGTSNIPKRVTTFYPNYLSITADNQKKTLISYDDILSLQETQHLYILNCRNNISVLLDKKGFTFGDIHTVKENIKSLK